MATANDRRGIGRGWLTTLLGILVLVTGGFVLGLVVGVVSEEPRLVAGHVAGRSTEIDWTAARQSEAANGETRDSFVKNRGETSESIREVPSVAAPPPDLRRESEPLDYMIQVGAFAEGLPAEQLADRLREAGYPAQVIVPLEDDRWRVRVGPVRDRTVADGVALRLKSEEQLPTWIVRQPGS